MTSKLCRNLKKNLLDKTFAPCTSGLIFHDTCLLVLEKFLVTFPFRWPHNILYKNDSFLPFSPSIYMYQLYVSPNYDDQLLL